MSEAELTRSEPASSTDAGSVFAPRRIAVAILAAAGLALVVNQTFRLGLFGFLPLATAYYFLTIAFFLAAAFLTLPAWRDLPRGLPIDWLLAALALGCGVWIAAHAEDAQTQGWDILAPPLATAIGALLLLLILEGVRRASGLAILLVCLLFGAFPMVAGHMPGVLWGVQLSPLDTIRAHVFGFESITGIPMRVTAEMLIGFILFGAVLTSTGGGAVFMDLAAALLGRRRGGPAKVAVVSSGFFGSLSGSVISNVLSTGTMTIPSMKKAGYRPAYAGAVEACASTGGALMPPVMGVVAFIMADFLNVPYREVMIAALVPSLLLYAALIIQIDAYAGREKLKGLPPEEVPPLGPTLLRGWPHLAALALLVFLIINVGIERQAPFWATLFLLTVTVLRDRAARSLSYLLDLLNAAAASIGQIVATLAAIGLIIGALSVTGVAGAFSRELIQYANNSLALLLIFGAVTSFVLGMGLTSSAVYIFLAIVLGPSLIGVGLDPIASHLFILYWGMLSFITPPVALAALAAASVAGSRPMETGLLAMRVGAILFVLPFMFVLEPALILRGDVPTIALSVTTAAVAIWALAGGFERWLPGVGRLGLAARCSALAAGGLLLIPDVRADLLGLAFLAVSSGLGLRANRRVGTAPDADAAV